MSPIHGDHLGFWVDGARADDVPGDDRGLAYGDGVFETVLVRTGRPRFLDAHLARLSKGCARLRIPFAALRELRADVEAAAAQAPALAVLKIVVTRGSALRRGYAADGAEVPRRIVSLWSADPLANLADGVALARTSVRAADQPALAGIKHLNRLENVLAAGEARASGAFDALMLGGDDRLVSGAMSNVFIVNAGVLSTPLIDRAGVAGVMRGVVLRECGVLGLTVTQKNLMLEDLFTASEVFVTNARIGVVPVRRVGEHAFDMNDTARRLAAHIEALDA
jgi:4-amino-4-deoxychorismate lyase